MGHLAVFRRGLAARPTNAKPSKHQRVKLPLIPEPNNNVSFELSGERLLELELEAENNNA